MVDVNDVLYRLSHATVYINYDGYATYSMTFKPKAKVRLMTAAKIFCQKTRGYVKIGPGASTGLPKYFLKFPTIKTNGGHCYYASYADILRLGKRMTDSSWINSR